MDANGEDGSGKSREIKYQVGWKKGRIIMGSDVRQETKGKQEDAPLPGVGPIGSAFRRLLSEAPPISGESIYRYALLLPALVFAVTLLLFYLLLN